MKSPLEILKTVPAESIEHNLGVLHKNKTQTVVEQAINDAPLAYIVESMYKDLSRYNENKLRTIIQVTSELKGVWQGNDLAEARLFEPEKVAEEIKEGDERQNCAPVGKFLLYAAAFLSIPFFYEIGGHIIASDPVNTGWALGSLFPSIGSIVAGLMTRDHAKCKDFKHREAYTKLRYNAEVLDDYIRLEGYLKNLKNQYDFLDKSPFEFLESLNAQKENEEESQPVVEEEGQNEMAETG